MSVETKLGEYLKNVRQGVPVGGEVSEVAARVEHTFTELGLPWGREPNGSWKIASDVGEVRAGLDDEQEVLSLWQILGPMPSNPKKSWPFMMTLLKMNSSMRGACYSIFEPEDGSPPLLAIVGRIAAKNLDPEEVALALSSVFEMSHVFDK